MTKHRKYDWWIFHLHVWDDQCFNFFIARTCWFSAKGPRVRKLFSERYGYDQPVFHLCGWRMWIPALRRKTRGKRVEPVEPKRLRIHLLLPADKAERTEESERKGISK